MKKSNNKLNVVIIMSKAISANGAQNQTKCSKV